MINSYGLHSKRLFCRAYYGTNYFRGLGLLKHETNIGRDMLTSVLCEESCKENIRDYEEFQLKNQKNYNRITDNINRLVKKLWLDFVLTKLLTP